jgi:hypothetical protein
VSDQQKPVLDEQTFGKLLEAAFVIQEHGGELPQRARKPETRIPVGIDQKPARESSGNQVSASTAGVSQPSPISEKNSAGKFSDSALPARDAYAPALAQIVETQQQILTQGLEFEKALVLVAQRATQITKASGAAVGILEDAAQGKKLQYRAVHGLLALPAGSEVAREKALSFTCLRSGEVVRCADVKADLLLDTEQCRSRGIGSLIAVPIYRDKGIAGALEVYFATANAFTEADLHSCQVMAGLVTEALARESGVSSRKSLAAERATLLAALEKLQPNLAALMQSSAVKASAGKNATSSAAAPRTAEPTATAPTATVATASASAAEVPGAASNLAPAQSFPCRKCGHELVGEEMFCGKCGSPRTTEYQPPTMQSKLASLWHMQQAGKSTTVVPANGAENRAERTKKPSLHIAVEPWEAVLSELKDPFEEPEPELEHHPKPELDLKLDVKLDGKLDGKDEPIEIPSAAAFSSAISSSSSSSFSSTPASHEGAVEEVLDPEYVESYSAAGLPLTAEAEEETEENKKENRENEDAEELVEAPATATALSPFVHQLTWSSAAKAKESFEQLAASSKQNSFVRFWNTRRGDVYLAVAVILVAGVIRWSIRSDYSFGASSAAAKASHHRAAADADLTMFDKFLISIGLADPPDPPENKGNPDTQVWVDLHSALYYCPGADLYGKTPKGKYTTQRDAQIGQFEPAYRKACN